MCKTVQTLKKYLKVNVKNRFWGSFIELGIWKKDKMEIKRKPLALMCFDNQRIDRTVKIIFGH